MKLSSLQSKIIAVFLVFLSLIIVSACVNSSNKAAPVQPANSLLPEKPDSPSKQAWETEWDKTLASAKKEKQVVVMGGFGAALAREPFIHAMKEKYNIDLDITLGQVPVILQAIISQRRAGIYQNDIYLAGAISIVGEMLPRELLQP